VQAQTQKGQPPLGFQGRQEPRGNGAHGRPKDTFAISRKRQRRGVLPDPDSRIANLQVQKRQSRPSSATRKAMFKNALLRRRSGPNSCASSNGPISEIVPRPDGMALFAVTMSQKVTGKERCSRNRQKPMFARCSEKGVCNLLASESACARPDRALLTSGQEQSRHAQRAEEAFRRGMLQRDRFCRARPAPAINRGRFGKPMLRNCLVALGFATAPPMKISICQRI